MKTFSHTMLHSLTKESKLVYMARPESYPFKQIEGINNATPPKLSEAKKMTDAAMKEFTDKAAEWKKSDNGQSETFKTKVGVVEAELAGKQAAWTAIFEAVGVTPNSVLEATAVPDFKAFGKALELKITEVSAEAVTDRVEVKKKELTEKVAELELTYSETTIKAAVDAEVARYTVGITDEAIKAKVTAIITTNLSSFGSKSLAALKAVKDGAAYKAISTPDAVIKESDLDSALASLKDSNLFPADIPELWEKAEGAALKKQTDKFADAAVKVAAKFDNLPKGTEATKARTAQQATIDALFDQLSKGTVSPAELIADTRQIETSILIGHLKDTLPELNVEIGQIFKTYELGKWGEGNAVDPAKLQQIIAEIDANPELKARINISYEGGADSKEFTLNANRYDATYSKYIAGAKRLLAVPALQNDPAVKANMALITELSGITDKAGFKKFLDDHRSQLAYLKSSTGPFNTVLAYLRMENVVGEEKLKTAEVGKAGLYLETGASDTKYRYALVMTYNAEVTPAEADPITGAKGAAADSDPAADPTPDAPTSTVDLTGQTIKDGERASINGISYVYDHGKYTIDNPDYTHPLDEEEFNIVIGKTIPTDDYIKAKTKTTIFNGEQTAAGYDSATKTMRGTYTTTSGEVITLTHDLKTGKLTVAPADQTPASIEALLVDKSRETIALAIAYGVDLSQLASDPANPDNALQEAIKAGDYNLALETLLADPSPSPILMAECFKRADLAVIRAKRADLLSKLNLVNLVENFKGEKLSENYLYDKLTAVTNTNEIIDQNLLNAILDNLTVEDAKVVELLKQPENKANEKLLTRYLTSEAFQDANASMKDVNIAAILAHKGKLMDLPAKVITFITANFEATDAGQKAILEKILTEVDISVDTQKAVYIAAYDKLGYAFDNLPTETSLWAKYQIASDQKDILVPGMVELLAKPNAKDYLESWLKLYTGTIEVGAITDANVDSAIKIAEALKAIGGSKAPYALYKLEAQIKLFKPDYTEAVDNTKEKIAEGFLAVVRAEETSDKEKLATIELILTDTDLIAVYPDVSGAPNPVVSEIKDIKASIFYNQGRYAEVTLDDLKDENKKLLVTTMTALNEATPVAPSDEDLQKLIAAKDVVGTKALMSLALNDDLPLSQKKSLYQGLGMDGSVKEVEVAALVTLFDDAETDGTKIENAITFALDLGADEFTDAMRDRIVVLLKTDKTSVSFVESILDAYGERFADSEVRIDITLTREMYKTALAIFDAEGGTLTLKNITDGIADSGAYKLEMDAVLNVLKQKNRAITTAANKDQEYVFYRENVVDSALEDAEKLQTATNLGLESEVIELGALSYKDTLTPDEVNRLIELAGKHNDKLSMEWLSKLQLTSMDAVTAAALSKWPGTFLQFDTLTSIDSAALGAIMAFSGELTLPKLKNLDSGHYEQLATRTGDPLNLSETEYNKFAEWYKTYEITPETTKMAELKTALEADIEEEEGEWNFDQSDNPVGGEDYYTEDESQAKFVTALIGKLDSVGYMPADKDAMISLAKSFGDKDGDFEYGIGASDENNAKMEAAMEASIKALKKAHIDTRTESLTELLVVGI